MNQKSMETSFLSENNNIPEMIEESADRRVQKSILESQDDPYMFNNYNPYQNQYSPSNSFMPNPYQNQYPMPFQYPKRNNPIMQNNMFENSMKSMLNQIIPIQNKNPSLHHHPIKGERMDFSNLKYGQSIMN